MRTYDIIHNARGFTVYVPLRTTDAIGTRFT